MRSPRRVIARANQPRYAAGGGQPILFGSQSCARARLPNNTRPRLPRANPSACANK